MVCVCVLFNEYQYLSITILGALIVFHRFDVTREGGGAAGLNCLFEPRVIPQEYGNYIPK